MHRHQRRRARRVHRTDGPRRSRKYDSRLAMMLSAPPVLLHASTWAGRLTARYPYSLRHAPTNTPVCERRSEFGRNARMLQRLPRHFEQQPLLRIHLGRFARRRSRRSPRRTRRRHRGTSPTGWCATAPRPPPASRRRTAAQRSGGHLADRGSARHTGTAIARPGPVMPPGNRQPRPITAIGSSIGRRWRPSRRVVVRFDPRRRSGTRPAH